MCISQLLPASRCSQVITQVDRTSSSPITHTRTGTCTAMSPPCLLHALQPVWVELHAEGFPDVLAAACRPRHLEPGTTRQCCDQGPGGSKH